jgi:hypothetical protein
MPEYNLSENLALISAPKVKAPVKFGPNPTDILQPAMHDKLVTHILRRIVLAEPSRRQRVSNYMAIETDLLGVVESTGTDCERRVNRDSGHDVSVPDAIYPFGWNQLQKFAAEVCSLVMPAEAPYAVATGFEFKDKAVALTKAFRHQGVMLDHRNNVHGAIFDMIALDTGVLHFGMKTIRSSTVGRSLSNEALLTPEDFTGVQFRQGDPYNSTWDQNVSLADLATDGEFFSEFDITSPFLLNRAKGKTNFMLPDLLASVTASAVEMANNAGIGAMASSFEQDAGSSNWFYYQPEIAKSRMQILEDQGSNRGGTQTNFSGLFSQTSGKGFGWAEHAAERVHITKTYIRLRPSEFGLGPTLTKAAQADEGFSIWEIHMIGAGYICYAAPCEAKVDRFPVAVGSMNFRRRFGRSFNFGNHAAQMGLFASTIMNLMKRSMRKGVEGGLTIYNSNLLNLDKIEDSSSGRVGVNMNMHGDDIRRHILQLSDLPDYKNSMGDVDRVNALLAEMFPANSQPAMAGLDRATTYQAQAVMATGMRTLLLFAGLADGQLMIPARFFLQRLNLIHAADMNYVDETSGQLAKLTAEDLQRASFELVQAQPLIGIDRMRMENLLMQMINISIQSGGQLPPTAALMMEHLISISSIILNAEDYKAAAAQEQQALAEAQAAEVAAQAPSGAPPTAGAPAIGPATGQGLGR